MVDKQEAIIEGHKFVFSKLREVQKILAQDKVLLIEENGVGKSFTN